MCGTLFLHRRVQTVCKGWLCREPPPRAFGPREVWVGVYGRTRIGRPTGGCAGCLTSRLRASGGRAAGMATPAVDGRREPPGRCCLLCAARALLVDRRVLLCDEATSSVDSQTDAAIQRVLRSQFEDRTVITIAHRLQSTHESIGRIQLPHLDRPHHHEQVVHDGHHWLLLQVVPGDLEPQLPQRPRLQVHGQLHRLDRLALAEARDNGQSLQARLPAGQRPSDGSIVPGPSASLHCEVERLFVVRARSTYLPPTLHPSICLLNITSKTIMQLWKDTFFPTAIIGWLVILFSVLYRPK